MTSEQRHELRYQRRRQKRQEKRQNFMKEYDDFNKIFTYEHLYDAYKKSRKNVSWKASTQKYIMEAPLIVYQTYKELHEGTFKSDGFFEFKLNERGKIRYIRSVTIKERVVQRCLCDYALVPVLSKTFIYDNYASLKNKGYHFAINRICKNLRQQYQSNENFYILLFDFSKFFDKISHKLCKQILEKHFKDEKILKLSNHFIDCFGEVGLGLGSQISQILALASANRLDHYIKEVLHITGYGRYMDDGYLIHKDKKYLQYCLIKIRQICKKLGIVLNEKKTQIVKISHGFNWLKCRFYITKQGKIIKKIFKKSVTRERRKLKKLAVFLQHNRLTPMDVYAGYQSWRSYAKNFNSWRTLNTMGQLYDSLFITPWLYEG